jgi:hypothetical protein
MEFITPVKIKIVGIQYHKEKFEFEYCKLDNFDIEYENDGQKIKINPLDCPDLEELTSEIETYLDENYNKNSCLSK